MARRRMIDPNTDWKDRYFKKAIIPVLLRNEIILRDNGICQYCGKEGIIEDFHGRLRVYELVCNGNHKIPFEIDHIKPEFKGGTLAQDNLKLACRKCNRSKGYKERGIGFG